MVRAAHIVIVAKARDVLGIRRRSGASAILIIRTVNRRRIDIGGQASVAARAARRDVRRPGYSIRDVLDPLLVSYKFSPVTRRVDGCSLGKIQIEGEVNAFLVLHMFASNLLLGGADHGCLGGCGRRPVIIHCIHAVMRRMPIIHWAEDQGPAGDGLFVTSKLVWANCSVSNCRRIVGASELREIIIVLNFLIKRNFMMCGIV